MRSKSPSSGSPPLLLLPALLLSLSACSDRAIESTSENDIEQPTTPGTMYSPCESHDDCGPLDHCMYPAGENGFCTEPCEDSDPESCQPLGDSTTTCVSTGDPVAILCALDCSTTLCPRGMSCESVEGNDGVQRICF